MRRARATAWLVVAIGVAIVGVGCSREVVHDLDARDEKRAVVALDRAGIEVSVEHATDGARVSVSADDASRATAILAAESIPRAVRPTDDDGLFALDAPARHGNKAATDLEETLALIDGVIDARVQLATPPTDPFAAALGEEHVARPTAAVFLRHRAGASPIAGNDVRGLVAAAIPDLRSNDVTVVFSPAAAVTNDVGQSIVHVGPFAVARASAASLRLALTIGLALLFSLGALLVGVVFRGRRSHADGSANVVA